MRRLLLAAVLALAFAPSALADGGGALLSAGGLGVTSARAPVRYVALPARAATVLAAVSKRNASVVAFRSLAGAWGIPDVTVQGRAGGLSRDGKLLVLGDASPQMTPLRRTTRFLLIETRTLAARRVVLHGDFAYDALSPDRATLYLIQHVTGRDLTRYRVRAYDLRARRLLPGAIADRRQRGWTMAGYPVARATSPDGRWVYTLYRQSRNYPFVHALDTVARRAVCVAVPEPWEDGLSTGGLRLDGRRLLVADRPGGATRYTLDTRSFRVTEPSGGGGPPIALAGGGAVTALLLAATLVLARRRSARRS